MSHRLSGRLAKLEARRLPEADTADAPPVLSEAFVAEVWRLLWAYGAFTSLDAMLDAILGVLTDEATRAAVSHILEESPTDAL